MKWSEKPHYVYRLYDSIGRLLYVGMAEDVRYRFPRHRYRNYEWFSQVVRIESNKYKNRESAEIMEMIQINSLHPIHNKRRKREVHWHGY